MVTSCWIASWQKKGHYPAVNVARSISRVFSDVTPSNHQEVVQRLRRLMATYDEVEDLIRIGAYQPNASPDVDRAIKLLPLINDFLNQRPNEFTSMEDAQAEMARILATA